MSLWGWIADNIWYSNPLTAQAYLLYKYLNRRTPKFTPPGEVPQSAAAGRVIPIVYGKTRVTGNVVDWATYVDPAYSYLQPLLIGVCEGTIAGFGRVWRDKEVHETAQGFGLTPYLGDATGLYFAASDIGVGPAYPWLACLFSRYQVIAGAIGSLSYEVKGSQCTGAEDDANPADVIQDLLPNAIYGAGVPWSIVTDTGQDGTAASSARRYWAQEPIWISPALTEQKASSGWLGEILKAGNADTLWKEGKLYVFPYCDQVVGTYAPVTTIQYALTTNDFLRDGDEDPIDADVQPTVDTRNVVPVEFLERTPASTDVGSLPGLPSGSYPPGTAVRLTTDHKRYIVSADGASWSWDMAFAYNASVVESPDPVDVAQLGVRKASPEQIHMITLRDVATKVSRILSQRSVRTRNVYTFRLPWRFCRLEPMDLVSLTDALFGLSAQVVRILAVEERLDANGNLELEVTAEEWPFGIASAVAHATASSDAGGATARTMDAEATALEAAADNWSASATLPSVGATYNALAADPVEQRIVAVGSSTVAALSLDGGLSWASKTITPAGSYYAVVHTGTFFSAIGTAVSKSTDGSTWSAGTMPGGSPTYRGLAYGNGTLVAVGTNLCAISTDGLSWTPKTIPAGAYTAVAYVPGVGFAAVGDGCAAYSADGVTWYAAAAAPTYASSIACDGARLVTAGNSNHVNISDDGGNHWYYTVAPAPGRYQSLKALYGLTYAGSGVWAMVGAGGGLNQCSTARALHFDNNHGSPIAAGTFIFHPGIPFGGTAIARAGRRYVVIGGDKFSVSSPA